MTDYRIACEGTDGATATAVLLDLPNRPTSLVTQGSGTLRFETDAAVGGSSGIRIISAASGTLYTVARVVAPDSDPDIGTAIGVSLAFKPRSAIASDCILFTIRQNGTDTKALNLYINSTLHVGLRNSAGSEFGTTSPSLSADATYWLSIYANKTGGNVNIDLIAADKTTVLKNWAGSSVSMGAAANLAGMEVGTVNVANVTLDADSILVRTGASTKPELWDEAPVNSAPVADAGDDQTNIEPYATFQLDGTGSNDPDSDGITYLWSQLSGPTCTLSSNTVAQPTGIAPPSTMGAELVYQLVVNDGDLNSSPDTVSIMVRPHTIWSIIDPEIPTLAPIRVTIIDS